MKKLLVLGAGVMQAPLIKRAKELGIYTVVVGSKGNYPGLKFADKSVLLDFMDADAVERIAREEGIDGIFTCGLDMPVPTMATVSERLGLPGISHEAGQLVTDKEKMKAFWASYVLHSNKSGRFLEVKYADAIKKNVCGEYLNVTIGDEVQPFSGSNWTLGVLLLKFDSIEDMCEKVDYMERYISVEVA